MAIYLIVLLCLLNHACFSGSRMVMSLYALELGATPFTIGVLMALYAICPLFFAIYAGRLADRLGPRRPMIAGTVGMGIGIGDRRRAGDVCARDIHRAHSAADVRQAHE